MMNWESLIAERSRPASTICKIEDAVKRNKHRRIKKWYEQHPNYNAEYYAAHREKKLAENAEWKRNNPEKNRLYIQRYRERHKHDEAWLAKKREWNRQYRARKRAEQKLNKEKTKE